VKALRWKPDSLTLYFAIFPRGGKEMGGGVWSYSFTDIDPLNHVNATEAMGDWAIFQFSPDGHLAAFCTKPEGPGYTCGKLYVLDIGLRLARPVPIPKECDPVNLVWSPRGERLAVACSPDIGIGSKIFSVDPLSLTTAQLTPGRWSDFSPSWSPDGNKIAFRSCIETCTIWIMDANNGADRVEVGTTIIGTGRLVWTPDGDLLAAVRDEPNFAPGIYRISTATGGAVLLTPGKLTRLMGLRRFQIP
ncbi:MAG: PD40 domain-containing protein, partial [Chloroflexi bacterium]|nr:PD40 domain-containing protein [Chloroflexota bacterium]